MKIARTFATIFGCIGAVLMAGALVLCLVYLDKPAGMVGMPTDAMACSEEMMDALASGDFAQAANKMYGQPDLGVDRTPADAVEAMIWDAFVDGISYEFVGVCYGADTGICRDASLTTLDISSVTENLQSRAQALLDRDEESQNTMTEEILRQAAEEAIREDAEFVTRNVTLKLIYRDGQWWVVPDQALLQAISGSAA